MLRLQDVAIGFVVIVCASASSAQVPRPSAGRGDAVVTTVLDITLSSPPCDELSKIWVVMDGDENHPIPGDQAGLCHWTATARTGTFDANLSDFSLRLGIARTPCQHAEIDRINGRKIGKLIFQCCGTDARRVKISTNQEMPISYVREVSKDATDANSVPCKESYSFVKQPVDILSVWYPADALAPQAVNGPDRQSTSSGETLRVQFGERDPKKTTPLLIFNHRSVTKFLKSNSLTSEHILAAMREQRAKGLIATPPSFSVAADKAEKARLDQIGLSSVTVTLAK